MSETPLDAQKQKEATARYDSLTRRIAAVDRDISGALDSERLAVLNDKRADLAAQRDAVSAEMSAYERRSNGDLETLQRKVLDLGRALASDNPAEAHALVAECANALVRIDARIFGLEGRMSGLESDVSAIKYQINPPRIVVALRILAVLAIVFGIVIGAWQSIVLFVLYPFFGLTLEAVILSLAAVMLLYAQAKLEERAK